MGSTIRARSLGSGRGVPRLDCWLPPGSCSQRLSLSAPDPQAGRPDAVTTWRWLTMLGEGRGGVQKVLRGPHGREKPLTAWGGDMGHMGRGGVQVSEDEGRTVPPRWGPRQGCLLGPCWVEGNGGQPGWLCASRSQSPCMPCLRLCSAVSPDVTGEGARLKPRGPEPPMPGGGLVWGLQKSPGPDGLLSCPVHGALLTPFQGPAHPSPLVTEPPHFLWPDGYSRCSSRSCDLVCPCLGFPWRGNGRWW